MLRVFSIGMVFQDTLDRISTIGWPESLSIIGGFKLILIQWGSSLSISDMSPNLSVTVSGYSNRWMCGVANCNSSSANPHLSSVQFACTVMSPHSNKHLEFD